MNNLPPNHPLFTKREAEEIARRREMTYEERYWEDKETMLNEHHQSGILSDLEYNEAMENMKREKLFYQQYNADIEKDNIRFKHEENKTVATYTTRKLDLFTHKIVDQTVIMIVYVNEETYDPKYELMEELL